MGSLSLGRLPVLFYLRYGLHQINMCWCRFGPRVSLVAGERTHWHTDFCPSPSPLSQCALHGAGSAGGLMHRRRGSLIAVDSTQIAHVYLPGKASELFSWSAFNFFFPSSSFFFYFWPSRFRRALWDGCDEMEYREGNLSSVCTITFI